MILKETKACNDDLIDKIFNKEESQLICSLPINKRGGEVGFSTNTNGSFKLLLKRNLEEWSSEIMKNLSLLWLENPNITHLEGLKIDMEQVTKLEEYYFVKSMEGGSR